MAFTRQLWLGRVAQSGHSGYLDGHNPITRPQQAQARNAFAARQRDYS
jgi:hypothetical protein